MHFSDNKKAADTFLISYILILGLWFFYHGIFAGNDYNLNFHLIGKFPVERGHSSLGQDYAYPWNGAKNFLDKDSSVYYDPKCFLPSDQLCYHYAATPFVPLAFAGLSEFSYLSSYRIYIVGLLALWIIGTIVLSRIYKFQTSHLALLIGVVLLSCPYHFEFERGNWHSLVFLLVLFSYYNLHWKRDIISAAFFIVIAMALKLHPGLIIAYFFIKGHFRFAAYAGLFLIAIFFMTGGLSMYKIYMFVVKSYSSIMASQGGWSNHSTVSAIGHLFNIHEQSELKIAIATTINGLLAISALCYFFLMNKHANNKTILNLELSIIFIIANITPATASRYSIAYLPFVIFAFADAFSSIAIKEKLKRYWPAILIITAIICSYILMAPIGRVTGEYNFINQYIHGRILLNIRNIWIFLILLLILLYYLHWQLCKANTPVENKNPWKTWYETDLSKCITGIKNLISDFQFRGLLNLIDPIEKRNSKSVMLIRFTVILLSAYLIYYASIGTVHVNKPRRPNAENIQNKSDSESRQQNAEKNQNTKKDTKSRRPHTENKQNTKRNPESRRITPKTRRQNTNQADPEPPPEIKNTR